MLKVLVAGARGMLGRRVVEKAAGRFDAAGFDLEECDITRPEAVEAVVAAAAPDVVINCAAMTDVDGCESRFEEAMRVNGGGAANLAAAANRAGASILHMSTDYVFDGSKPAPYVEDDPVSPLGAYGKSKLAGEEGVRENNPRHWIVRTQWLYGPDGKNFVDTIRTAAAERRRSAGQSRSKPEPIRVVNDQFGCPTYSVDLARQILRIVLEGAPFGVYHCSSRGSCSWFELAARVVALSGMADIPVVPIPSAELRRPAPRPANSVLRNLRLEETIGDGMPHWTGALEDYMKSLGCQARSLPDRSS